MKLDWLRRAKSGGRIATFATATPVANSITEAYVVQRYLRPDLLEEAGIEEFDAWAATFGEVVSGVELTPAAALSVSSRASPSSPTSPSCSRCCPSPQP